MVPNSLVVVAHPRARSFSHALAGAAEHALRERGHDVAHHDLYAEGFDPVLTERGADTVLTTHEPAPDLDADELVAAHRRELVEAHTLVVVHPNWWGKPPAMMAGWMDRVLAPGVVYELDDAAGAPRCLLGLQHLFVVNTGDTELHREARAFGDPLESMWRYCVGAYLGDATIDRMLIGPMAGSTPAQRARWLEQARRRAAGLPSGRAATGCG